MLPLSFDTLAISTSVGLAGVDPRQRLRVSLAMTGFETAMPLVGLLAGAGLAQGIGHGSRFLAAAILAAAGIYFIWESLHEYEHPRVQGQLAWTTLIALGVSVSLDELAIGFAGGLSGLPIVALAVILGVQALVASQVGLRFGSFLSERYTEIAERAGGVVLIACAVLMAVQTT